MVVSVRHALIEIARRRQRPGSGSSPAFLLERTASMEWPDLTVPLGAIPWAVAGAVATRRYMPERRTQDLDIVVTVTDVAAVRERLNTAGYTFLGDLRIGGSSWRALDGTEVDVLECGAPWCATALAQANANRDAQGLPVLPLPYLVLMKMQAGRARDIGDLAQMLGQADPLALEEVRAIVGRFAPADLDDLESLIVLGQLEMGTDSR
jgi:hypothetical protein